MKIGSPYTDNVEVGSSTLPGPTGSGEFRNQEPATRPAFYIPNRIPKKTNCRRCIVVWIYMNLYSYSPFTCLAFCSHLYTGLKTSILMFFSPLSHAPGNHFQLLPKPYKSVSQKVLCHLSTLSASIVPPTITTHQVWKCNTNRTTNRHPSTGWRRSLVNLLAFYVDGNSACLVVSDSLAYFNRFQ